MDISLIHKQNTILPISIDEIRSLSYLLDRGIDLETMIHITFKSDEKIIECLNQGIPLIEILTRSKKLYYRYISLIGKKLRLKQTIECVDQIEAVSNELLKKLISKIAYPIFLYLFAFVMIVFFSNYVFVSMSTYFENDRLIGWINILKVILGVGIFIIMFMLIFLYSIFYHFEKVSLIFDHLAWFKFIKKISTMQFIIIFSELIKTGMNTYDVLALMCEFTFSSSGHIAKKILDDLNRGYDIEWCFEHNRLIDDLFKRMILYALHINETNKIMDIYMDKTKNDLYKQIQRWSLYVQLFAYGCIGILVIVVYQVMLLPLNMLNTF